MKTFIAKIIMMLVVMFGISNYSMYLMTGRTPFSNFKFELPDFNITKPELDSLPSIPGTSNEQEAFKWVDENGVTHYSSEAPPTAEQEVELIKVNPDTNLIRGLEMEEAPKEKDESETAVTPVQGPLYSPENIQKIMDQARDVENKLQDRYQKQEEILNSQ